VAFSFLCETLAFLPVLSTIFYITQQGRSISLTPPAIYTNTRASSCSTSSLRNGMWTQDDELRGSDRLQGLCTYLLPLIDGDPICTLYSPVPVLGALNDFPGPLLTISQCSHSLVLGCSARLGLSFQYGHKSETCDFRRNKRRN
jgi:hypothetical protein